MKKVVTFGELMLRLAPMGYLRFVQSENYEATFGGAEANVAVSLANYGEDVAFVSKLPAHEIGQAAVNSLRKFGVDTSKVVRGGERVGIYYCEKGASQRPSKVVYDRAYSSIAMATAEDFDWDAIFEGVEWFHFTGITPALSDGVADSGGEAPELLELLARPLDRDCSLEDFAEEILALGRRLQRHPDDLTVALARVREIL